MSGIPSSMRASAPDTRLLEMQTRWHELRKAWADEGFPSSSQAKKAFDFHDDKLCQYIWDTTQAAIAEDRRKHPKAKRNQPVPTDSSPTRHLP